MDQTTVMAAGCRTAKRPPQASLDCESVNAPGQRIFAMGTMLMVSTGNCIALRVVFGDR